MVMSSLSRVVLLGGCPIGGAAYHWLDNIVGVNPGPVIGSNPDCGDRTSAATMAGANIAVNEPTLIDAGLRVEA